MKAKLKLLFLCGLIILLGCNKETPIKPGVSSNIIPEPNIYKFNILVDGEIPNSPKIDMELQVIDKDTMTSYDGRIERRGGFSISFPKHSYEIDFDEDVSMAGLPADDDWIFNANYIDKTFIRHVMSYDLFRAMNENNRASNTEYIELSLNGEYNGLYVLMEKLDRSTLMVDKNDTSAVIFKEPPLFNFDIITPQYPDNYYQQTYPKKEVFDKTGFIEMIRSFILTSSDDEFSANITDFFDINNVIDWHLLLLLSNNSDGILKNFYLYKIDKETPLRIAPWDYDYSFGRDGDNELNLIRPLDPERANLLRRLLTLDWYKSKMKERWYELVDQNIFTPKALKKRIGNYRRLLESFVEKNASIWSYSGYAYYDENDFEAELWIMNTYIDLRFEQLHEYFGQL